jgi:hypothetical protein
MVTWSALLLPALLSAVLVFVASSVIHMVLQLHNPDYRKLPNEDDVRAAIKKGAAPPGQYILPHCTDPKEGASPEMQRKFAEGPVGVLYIRENGATRLGPFLGKWFAYSIVVSLLAGYVARIEVPAGADWMSVFRVVSVSAWLAYAWQSPADSIWKGKPWVVTFRAMFDGIVYAALTGAAFAWLWPATA